MIVVLPQIIFLKDTTNNMSDCKDAQADQNFQMCTRANFGYMRYMHAQIIQRIFAMRSAQWNYHYFNDQHSLNIK